MAIVPETAYYALLEVFVFLAVAELLQPLAKKISVPAIASYLLLGLLLSGFALGGVVDRLVGVEIFAPDNAYVLLFADFSVVLLLFAAGLGSGFRGLREAGIPAVVAAIAGDLVPFALTFVIVSRFEPTNVALLVGVAVGPSSAAVVASLRDSEGVGSTPGGSFLMNVAALDDVVALLLLSAVLTLIAGRFDVLSITGNLAELVVTWLALLVAAILIVPYLFRVPALRESRGMPFLVLFALVALVISLGLSPIIGAFIAGLAVAESLAATRARELTEVLVLLFGALFFVVVGAQVDARQLGDPTVLGIGLLLGLIAAAGKVVGTYPLARWKLGSAPAARAVAAGLVPRGEIGLVVGSLGFASGIFGVEVLGEIVLMALVTTLVGAIVFRRFAPDLRGSAVA
jgi:Kef-type K+ transport system membrane component KefB